MKFLFPGGKHKALTFSYDDGETYDIKLAQILRSHGMKGTFNLNSGTLAETEGGKYVSKYKLAEIYEGHEIAIHGVEHKNLLDMTDEEVAIELMVDRQNLEKLIGKPIHGMAYAFGAFDERIMKIAQTVGVHYSRTVRENHFFDIPRNFLAWDATCHHNNDLINHGKRFLEVPEWRELSLMYVWGHSYEFGIPNDWSVIEEFTDMMQGQDSIWYATNGEIYDYITAMKRLEFTADGCWVKNPTSTEIWYRGKENAPTKIGAGEFVKVR
jgi:peptidoglycan/xylan/chitin deacetylase (PgdA/CDA1 family)